MYKKINNIDFIKNNSGSAIIEFSLVIFIIMLLIKLFISVTEYQSTIGKLDRISYSLAGIIRERNRLYSDDEMLTQNNVNDLASLANNMLLTSGISSNNFAITVETLHFNPTESAAPGNKIINDTKSEEFSVGTCHPIRSLREMADLSPYSNRGRWVPLYQVTLCLPAPTGYQALFSQTESIPILRSSAITIER
ncbi:tight adherence pilus pseudopilin TadF [Yersinia intermedia]|uniref:Tight adherance operon protein n=1 Tax=Yersinia intermedia TaxID=631 RepID=A0A209A0R2_YERIN|nr:tight adherence pilus pseudopilin TadF [Yersinia intermedia]OVZ86265.1 tight adherance operon protein [Yersinia intermedia]UZM71606.1 tight adherence pilus pseudopilin TadF [Yersinia intermedia]CNC15070.1 putative tight adherance operon protein [Yersinia intermedia]CRE93105.1 putative tight adherance operon protein [Yersinia intermedia]